jgi:hypothetical protein
MMAVKSADACGERGETRQAARDDFIGQGDSTSNPAAGSPASTATYYRINSIPLFRVLAIVRSKATPDQQQQWRVQSQT